MFSMGGGTLEAHLAWLVVGGEVADDGVKGTVAPVVDAPVLARLGTWCGVAFAVHEVWLERGVALLQTPEARR